MEVVYRKLCIDECDKIREIDPSQLIRRAWREVDGSRQLVEINYYDPDFPNGFEKHRTALKETLNTGGFAVGAFDHDLLLGFCSVNSDVFGEKSKYVLLDQLFVSKEARNKGLGKRLFFLAAKEARQRGADKFYVCAGSAEETIAFYFAIGCEEAKEINQVLYESDTRDYQLEFDFIKL